LIQGIAAADSVVLDCHKLLMTSSVTTALLYKNGKDSYRTFNQQAEYLWADQEIPEWFNLGKRTFECTKLMMSIQFYGIIHSYGLEALEENINRLYDLARSFAGLLKKEKQFDLLNLPQANIVCFRWNNRLLTEKKLSDVNARIRQVLLEEGKFYIVQTQLLDQLWLRVTLMNPFTSEADLPSLLDEIAKIGNGL